MDTRFSLILATLMVIAAPLGCADTDDGPGPGEVCDAEADSPCPDNFVCEPDGEGETRCQLPSGATCDPEESYCLPDLGCAEVQSGGNACFKPVQIEGTVSDATDENAIEGADVVALDQRRVAVTDVAVSDTEGAYALEIPVARTEEGAPIDKSFTLRADAADYQAFPSGLRQALPVNTSDATEQDGAWVLDRPPTDITLIPLPTQAQGNSTVSGEVLADEAGGVLVVAEGTDGSAYSAVAGRNGAYRIFDVPPGDYTVRGYKAGLQLQSTSVTVEDEPVTDVNLEVAEEDLSTVSGSISIVDAPGGAATSVFLVVESTFDEAFRRGEVPPGLRAPRTGEGDITSGFTFEDVPDGDYVVLAAFENDGLVRDPDQTIGGTGTVTVSVPESGNRDIQISESFKVTEALDVGEPGANRPTAVTSAPTLTWSDDSSEDYYTLEVYNAYGDLVWEDQMVDRVTGANQVEVQYGGPTESGMYYQFRATSWRDSGGGGDATAISRTEDLKGVFFFE